MARPRAHTVEVQDEGPEGMLGYVFRDPSLLQWALTHRSHAAELTGVPASTDPRHDNEQLEFLGDAVLGLVVTEILLDQFPHSREGELTRMRASLVSRRHLATVAARVGLGTHLRLGRGEERTGGRDKPALLANGLEAVLGAMYLDSRDHAGLQLVRAFVTREIVVPALPMLKGAIAGQSLLSDAVGDHKSALQEHLQSTGSGQPRYVLAAESGPDHHKLFRIEVYATGTAGDQRLLGDAEASSKKEAQQLAARRALELLDRERQVIPSPAAHALNAVDDVA